MKLSKLKEKLVSFSLQVEKDLQAAKKEQDNKRVEFLTGIQKELGKLVDQVMPDVIEEKATLEDDEEFFDAFEDEDVSEDEDVPKELEEQIQKIENELKLQEEIKSFLKLSNELKNLDKKNPTFAEKVNKLANLEGNINSLLDKPLLNKDNYKSLKENMEKDIQFISKDMWDRGVAHAESRLNKANEDFKHYDTEYNKNCKDGWNAINAACTNVKDSIVSALKGVGQYAKALVQGLGAIVGLADVKDVVNSSKQAKEHFDSATKSLETFGENVGKAANNALGAIQNNYLAHGRAKEAWVLSNEVAVTKFVADVAHTVENTVSGAQRQWKSMVNNVNNRLDKVQGFIQSRPDVFSKVSDALQGKFDAQQDNDEANDNDENLSGFPSYNK
ncbi:hypothetical protein BN59_01841 [Legionella massiliensis]|uniref:Uncharacterized protein n=1 Tax=Legionella massiliensis TaxID=1034943 RepID=A0A078L0M5_9GAMM|nr:hypothetical protein [Legionella massiliensis]CDZ77558.1 hypothetical protein BN59_01841 [Legionella massiliensis]CEE13296.1 hypothetical protein BN1094_01841 [Legionella massiliensis]